MSAVPSLVQNGHSGQSLPHPFLRWAGGKTRSIEFLTKHIPPGLVSGATYYEPFLGAGSLFFRLRPANAVLSDKNRDLVECYRAIRENPELVSRYLQEHRLRNSESYYYEMRDMFNRMTHSTSRASLFIYLNKTSFNGIWRVNDDGEFNVPYGRKDPPSLPKLEGLRAVSRVLRGVRLLHEDFRTAVGTTEKGDFVYFDPPYPPLNGTSCFTHYTKERFSRDDHEALAKLALSLSHRGCYVLISNADTEFIRSLYESEFWMHELEVTRWIRTDGKRYKVREIAVTNYEVIRD